MLLLGQDTAARIRTTARVDSNFALRSFEFSLDPGTGPIVVKGAVDGPSAKDRTYRLSLAINSGGVTRTETRELPEAPVMTLDLSRLLANSAWWQGPRQSTVLDPLRCRAPRVHSEWETAPSYEPTTDRAGVSGWT
jgi:hypothetical protein